MRDQGKGIKEEDQVHLFDQFYRVRTSENGYIEGSELRLYIAHEIVVQHGGRMWLESKQGQGSTFLFSLPLTPPAEEQ